MSIQQTGDFVNATVARIDADMMDAAATVARLKKERDAAKEVVRKMQKQLRKAEAETRAVIRELEDVARGGSPCDYCEARASDRCAGCVEGDARTEFRYARVDQAARARRGRQTPWS